MGLIFAIPISYRLHNPIHAVKWAQKSESNTAKNNITSTSLYHNKLLEVHQERVQEALSEGKPVPQEVLADYPALQQTAKENTNAIHDNADVSKKGENVDTPNPMVIAFFGRFPIDSKTKKAVVENIKAHFDKALSKGVYFPLARFGKIVVTGVNPDSELVTSFVESNDFLA